MNAIALHLLGINPIARPAFLSCAEPLTPEVKCRNGHFTSRPCEVCGTMTQPSNLNMLRDRKYCSPKCYRKASRTRHQSKS